jgi:hypothetical protein
MLDVYYCTQRYNECIEADQLEQAREWLSKFEFTDPNAEMMYIHPKLRAGKRVIATCDPDRVPSENELVIVYGNYPDWHYAYPFSSKMYRNVSFFGITEHDSVEYHPCWERIETIYILNLETRTDRYMDTLLQLVKVHAPLDRIIHHKITNNGEIGIVNCTRNHTLVLNDFKSSKRRYALILEDDFSFIDDVKHVWLTLDTFFQRRYNFTICLLSTSKYNEKCEYDDLLTLCKQSCTCSSGYIVSETSIDNVVSTVTDGFEKLKLHPEMAYEYAIDQYWRRLPNRFYFKKKLGFQRTTWSNIGNAINTNLD